VFKNKEFEAFLDTTDEWIVERTGIKERRFAAPGEYPSDMGLRASQQALERAGVDAEEVDLIVVPTVTPDTVFPATANWLQGKLNNKRAWSFDLNAGCSGFIFALNVVYNILRSGQHRYALLVGTERMSSLADMTNRDHCVLFGDAAGCLLLEAVDPEDNPEGYGIHDFYLRTDGTLIEPLRQVAGGSSKPATYQTVMRHEHFIHMDGRLVYKLAVRHMHESVVEVLKQVEVDPQDVDWFVGHQANARIITATQRRLGVPEEKVYMNVERYGNTTAATIPMCLDELHEDGKLKPGDKVVLFTFGTGLTWGSTYLVWGGGA
jgi:3-oxoacyl-[acyl-carrier-protein] synthase-3